MAISLRKKIFKHLNPHRIPNSIFVALLGGALGFAAYCLIFRFNFSVVNPFNIGWIFNTGGDLGQHYIGWLYYRDSPWHFPNIGQIDGLAYPFGISFVYLDTIPLFALLFKLLSPILPVHFQYFGLFTLISYVLQGVMGSLVLSRLTKHKSLIFLGTVFFVLSPILIGRSFAHTALTAHWLILLGIYFLIRFKQENSTTRFRVTTWSILLVLSVLIHAYFVPIVGTIFALSSIQQHRQWKLTLLSITVPVALTLLTFALLGGFSVGMKSIGGTGLGLYSHNLLSLFAPLGYSAFVDSLFSQSIQWEGLAYLGLGLILLLPIVWFWWLYNRRSQPLQQLREQIPNLITIKNLLYTACVVTVIVLALGPTIRFGGWVILDVDLPKIIDRTWGTFRATGRLFWPIYYLVITGVLAYIFFLTRQWPKHLVVMLIAPFALIQTIDIVRSPAAITKSEAVKHSLSSRNYDELTGTFVSKYCTKQTIVLVDNSVEPGIKMFHEVPRFIADCQPNMTSGYFARFPYNAIMSHADKRRSELIDGTKTIPATELYISQSQDFVREIDQEKYQSVRHSNYWIIQNRVIN